jgi:hypothetical protein
VLIVAAALVANPELALLIAAAGLTDRPGESVTDEDVR